MTTQPAITADRDDGTLRLEDPIQGRQYPLGVTEDVTVSVADTEAFTFPVDTAVEGELSRIFFPSIVGAYARRQDGTLIEELHGIELKEFPPGEYCLEFDPPVKLYLRFESAFSILAVGDQMIVDFGARTQVQFGIRSYHDHPAGTIEIPADPEAAMTGFSHLSSSLKTLSPERSWPTLRGYPPEITVGTTLDIPDDIAPPATDLEITCAPEWDQIYPLASLGYYLGAELVPGSNPLIRGPGWEHKIAPANRLNTEVGTLLRRLFLLDTVVRTAGLYDFKLASKVTIDERLDLDYRSLYEAPLAERTKRYLEIDPSQLRDILPTWRLTVDVAPSPSSAAFVPHVLNDLGIMRAHTDTQPGTTVLEDRQLSSDVDAFVRSLDRFARQRDPADEAETSFVSLQEVQSIEHAWAGPGKPLTADKLVLEGFENKLQRETAGDIEISLIVNDEKMAAETSSPLYGGRIDEMPFSVSKAGPLTVDELRSALTEDVDFLHYIGHVETDGFQCTDGVLELREADIDVAPAAFFLNACQSFEQGIEMVRAGSIGGIVTVSDVINQSATHLGQLVARLLNHGFSLRSALKIGQRENLVGNQYLVVGDGGTQIAQSVAGTPYVVDIESIRSDLFEVTIEGYPSVERGMGSLFSPLLEGVENHYLNTGQMDSFLLGRGELDEFISRQNTPLFYDGELYWSDEFSFY